MKKALRLAAIVVFVGPLAAGCVANTYAERLAALEGASAEDVKAAFGEPTRIDATSDGRALWSYYKTSARAFSNDYGVPGFAGDASRSETSQRSAVFICVTAFRFNAEGVVEAVDFDGEDC